MYCQGALTDGVALVIFKAKQVFVFKRYYFCKMQQHVVRKEVELSSTVVFDKISAAESAANEHIQEKQKQLEQSSDAEQIRQRQRVKTARETVEKESNLRLNKEQRNCEELLGKNRAEADKEAERWKIEARKQKTEAVKYLVDQFLSLRDI